MVIVLVEFTATGTGGGGLGGARRRSLIFGRSFRFRVRSIVGLRG